MVRKMLWCALRVRRLHEVKSLPGCGLEPSLRSNAFRPATHRARHIEGACLRGPLVAYPPLFIFMLTLFASAFFALVGMLST